MFLSAMSSNNVVFGFFKTCLCAGFVPHMGQFNFANLEFLYILNIIIIGGVSNWIIM